MSSYQKIENEIREIQNAITRIKKNKVDFDTTYSLSLLNNLLEQGKKLNKKVKAAEGRASDNKYAARADFRRQTMYYRMDEFTEIAHSILKRKTMEALQSSQEYSYEPFVTRLMEAVSDRRIVNVQGLEYGVRVEFLMNEVCGSIESYFKAVKEARKKNRTPKDPERTRKAKPKNPSSGNTIGAQEMASIFWAEKIYGAYEGKTVYRTVIKNGEKTKIDVTSLYKGKYEKIIQERFNVMKDPAPFWYLLEHGNATYIGEGVAYPEQKPTRFSEEAQREAENTINHIINAEVNSTTLLEENEWLVINNLENMLNRVLDDLRDLIISFENGLLSFRKQLVKELESVVYEKLINLNVGSPFGQLSDQYSAAKMKIEEQVNRLLAGDISGRVELGTYKGKDWEVRIRPRTIVLERKIASEISYVFRPLELKEIEALQKEAKSFYEDYKKTRKAMLKKKRY